MQHLSPGTCLSLQTAFSVKKMRNRCGEAISHNPPLLFITPTIKRKIPIFLLNWISQRETRMLCYVLITSGRLGLTRYQYAKG